MTTQRKFEIFGAVIVSALAFCFMRGWLLERDARDQAETTAAAAQQAIAQQAEAIKDRDAVNASYVQGLNNAARAVQTPAQAAQVIIHYLPAPAAGQPAQTIPTVTAAQLPADVVKDLPPAPSYGIVTGTQLEDIAKQDLACDATQHTLTTCQADKASLAAKLAASQTETAAWKAAAKGGTKFQRFVRVVKFVGCAGGGAIVGSLADKKSPAIGSAVGSAAGVITCSIL